MLSQKRLHFKLPLDKRCEIITAPSAESLLVRSAANELFYAQTTGKHLRLARNNVESAQWLTSKRFLVIDSLTHDLIFFKIVSEETTAEGIQFIATMHFAFQFVASVLLEFGVKLTHSDPIRLLRILPSGLLDLFLKEQYFIRMMVDFRTRTFRIVMSLEFGKFSVPLPMSDTCGIFCRKTKTLRFISSNENEFVAVISLSKALPMNFFTSSTNTIASISPDFCWLLIVTGLNLYELYLPAFEGPPWECLHSSAAYSTNPSKRNEEESVPEMRKGGSRVNLLWEKETIDVSSRNYAKLNFTSIGWIFPAGSANDTDVDSVWHCGVPDEYLTEQLEITGAHCTETESYIIARGLESGLILFGTKKHRCSSVIWMLFPHDSLVSFPESNSYPITLYYPMSTVVIAADAKTGFQKEVAEAAAPDPWEDLEENEVMEIAIHENIVDKAVDYLQKRYPERDHLFKPDYCKTAAAAIARNYLHGRNSVAAEQIMNLVGSNIVDEIRISFDITTDADFRQYLKDLLIMFDAFREADKEDFAFIQIYEAHLAEATTISLIRGWSADDRERNLVKVAISTSDKALVDSRSSGYTWKLLMDDQDVDRMISWIRGEANFTTNPIQTQFRELIATAVDESMEPVADEFARHGMFSSSELSNWQTYLMRIISAVGTSHPFFDQQNPDRLSAIPDNLKTQFLDFCVLNKLTSIILEFVHQPGFSDYVASKENSIPWLSLLLQFQSTCFDEFKQLGKLIVANAFFCFGNSITVEQLLKLEEFEVALGMICLLQESWPPNGFFDASEPATVLENLRRRLSKFPKLKEALFAPTAPESERAAKSVTLYRLLQNCAPYDPRKLFGWQQSNTFNQHYRTTVMPSFSSLELQQKFGYKKELDYSYYLKTGRPSFAYWSFVSNLTSENYKEELMAGRDMAFFLATFFSTDAAIASACVLFLEMLGIESLSTRINVEAARRIQNFQKTTSENSVGSACTIRDLFIDLYKYGSEFASSVIEDLVTATKSAIEHSMLYPASWEASSYWTLVNQFSELFDLPLSTLFLRTCAEHNDWFNFLVYCELFQYPVTLVASVMSHFTHPHIRENIYLILQTTKHAKKDQGRGDQPEAGRSIRSTLYSRIGVLAASDKTTSASSDEDLPMSSKTDAFDLLERQPDSLVLLLMNAQKSLHPWRELINYSIELQTPIYAMIASSEPGVHQLTCLCTLLFVNLTGIEKESLQQKFMPKLLRDIQWTKDHFEMISVFFTRRKKIRELAIALQLVTSATSLVFQFMDIAADVEDRRLVKLILSKMRRLGESIQRNTGSTEKYRDDDLENPKWAIGYGLKILAQLMLRLKKENEVEFRQVLFIIKESALLKSVDAQQDVGEVNNLIRDVLTLSQSVQFDASRILELKSLLRDFQKSSIWVIEEFRMVVWRSIYTRIHIELSERRSTEEVMELLQLAAATSSSPAEKCVLYTILWKLDDTDHRFSQAWIAKVDYALSSTAALDEWMDDPLIGAGPPKADLQNQLLLLGRLPVTDFAPLTNGSSSANPQDQIIGAMIAHLLKQGNLSLAARVSTVFGYLHGDLDAICTALALAKSTIRIENTPHWIVRLLRQPTRKISLTCANGSVNQEDEIVCWLQGIADVCTLGRDVVVAIIDNYCFAKLLQVEFDDMLHFSTSHILELLFAIPSSERLSLARRCLISFKAPTMEVTSFITDFICSILRRELEDVQCDVRSLGERIKPFLGVAIDLYAMGNHLIEASHSSVPSKSAALNGEDPKRDFRLSVELLIAAHEVFTKAGSLEGLARLITACKSVAKSAACYGDFNSVLRILNGIGRYSELNFIFNLIKEADQMELLFSRGVDKDPKLKSAILNFLRKYYPDDSNAFEMLAAAYSMHREIGEAFFEIAQDRLVLFKHRPIIDNVETQAELKKIIQYFMDAASNFSRADCHLRTEKCIEQARLVALQMVFLPTSLRLLSLNNPSGFVASHPRFAESYIYSQAYSVTDEWADAIYQNYVINGDIRYLQDFSIKFPVSPALVSEISRKFLTDANKPPTAPIYMKKLLRQINEIEVAFKLASELSLNDLSMEFLQVDDGAFLRDVMKI